MNHAIASTEVHTTWHARDAFGYAPPTQASPLPGEQAHDAAPSVLIIDNDTVDLAPLANNLRHLNYELRISKSAAQGLRSATKNPPELIILATEMPALNGLDACRIFKSRTDLATIPVMFISGCTERSKRLQAFAMGGVDYITKPFDLEEVTKRVESHAMYSCRIRALEREVRYLKENIEAGNFQSRPASTMALQLTNRETDCLVWLARGCRNENIADRLHISTATVEMHMSNARRKLAAATREQALVIATQFGLIKP